jgi:hypothetical protein
MHSAGLAGPRRWQTEHDVVNFTKDGRAYNYGLSSFDLEPAIGFS